MAKKKDIDHVPASLVDGAIAEVEKALGEGLVSSGRSLVDNKRHVIPICPSLDAALGGGIPEGCWVTLAGIEKGGKGQTALSFVTECQKPEHGNRPIFWLDVEHRLKERDLTGVRGLKVDPPHFTVIRSCEGKILSSEDFLNAAHIILRDVKNAIVVIDSVSALCNPKLISDGLGTSDYGSGNKLISQFCDLNAATVPLNKAVVVGIVQYYANTSGMGGPKEKSASRWKYQADVWLQLKYYERWMSGSGDNASQVGQKIHWVVKTSAIGPPGGKAESYLRYGAGIDKNYELFVAAKDLGLVSGAGSWVTLDYLAEKPELLDGTPYEGKAEVKVQGAEAAVNLLNEHPTWAAELASSYHTFLAG